jgi:hypothetical protein
MNKQEMLHTTKQQRIEEVALYQLNIDNYRLALTEVNKRNDPDLESFKAQLEELLRTSIVEQKKSQIMLDVIQSQIEE